MSALAENLQIDSPVTKKPIRRKTRVLIVSDHPAESRAVTARLRKLDLDVQLSLFDGKTMTAMPNKAPDAVLCHLTDYAEKGPKLAKVVRAHFHPRPVPVIGALSRPADDVSADFDSSLFAPMHPSQIAHRVHAMIRLGVMENEITRRLETLREDFGQDPELGDISPNRRFRVLFIGKASPAFMIVINALQDKGVDVVAAFTSFSAFDFLHGEPFDAVVMNALEQSEPALSISEAMRRNSKLYHVPTLFLVDEENFRDHELAYQKGARDIIPVDAEPAEISGRVLELANYHRIHEQLKSDIFSLTDESARDSSGFVFSKDFMRAHLPRLMVDAAKSYQPVSLIGLKIKPSNNAAFESKAFEGALNQTADLIQNLVRMQDVVCRWSKDCFILAFYNADKVETDLISNRLKELVESAGFKDNSAKDTSFTLICETHQHEIMPDDLSADEHLNKLAAELTKL